MTSGQVQDIGPGIMGVAVSAIARLSRLETAARPHVEELFEAHLELADWYEKGSRFGRTTGR